MGDRAGELIREVLLSAAARIERAGLARGRYHDGARACAQGAITDAATLVSAREGLSDPSVLRRACEQELWNTINEERPRMAHLTIVQWSDTTRQRVVVRTLRDLADVEGHVEVRA